MKQIHSHRSGLFGWTSTLTLLLACMALAIAGCGGGDESPDLDSPPDVPVPGSGPMAVETTPLEPVTELPEPFFVETNGIRMAVYEQGEGFPVVFSHGFPELAYSWRYQLPALAAAGYRAIAPDQRGYGLTDRPEEVEAYDVDTLCADLVGLLDALGIEQAVFVGHDWGGGVVWRMPLLYPDRVAGVVGVNTPFGRPPGPNPPIEMLRQARGEANYVVAFQEPGVADALLAENVDNVFRLFYRKNRLTAEEFAALPADAPERRFELLAAIENAEIDPNAELIITEPELRFYIETFRKTGFTGGINWYRNIDRNWENSRLLEYWVTAPALYVGAEDDTVLPPSSMDGTEQYLADIERQVIADCGHWTQQERPRELNRILIDWLDRKIGGE